MYFLHVLFPREQHLQNLKVFSTTNFSFRFACLLITSLYAFIFTKINICEPNIFHLFSHVQRMFFLNLIKSEKNIQPANLERFGKRRLSNASDPTSLFWTQHPTR